MSMPLSMVCGACGLVLGGPITWAGVAFAGCICAAALGISYMASEHTSGKRGSTWDKHTGTRAGGAEKKDSRMKYNKGGKKESDSDSDEGEKKQKCYYCRNVQVCKINSKGKPYCDGCK